MADWGVSRFQHGLSSYEQKGMIGCKAVREARIMGGVPMHAPRSEG
jgi:hypothetical protein